MELVDGLLRRDTNSAYKEPRLLLDNDIDKLGELTLGVVILKRELVSSASPPFNAEYDIR